MFRNIFTGLIFILAFECPLIAQNDWIFQKEKDGIKISNRHSQTSSSMM